MPALIRYASAAGGHRIAFSAVGAGPTLLVLPAGPWALMEIERAVPPWSAWYDRLAEQFSLVRYDPRGLGASAPGTVDFGLNAQIADLDAVVRQLQAPVALFAPQTAGPAAIAYAAQAPQRVSHLVLWSTFARGVDYYGNPNAEAMQALLARAPELFAEAVSQERVGWGLAPEVAHRVATLVSSQFSADRIQAYIAIMRAVDVSGSLSQVPCPALVIHRRGLPYPTVDTAQALAAGLPKAQFALLDGNSMAPWLGDPAALQKLLAGFLEAETSGRDGAASSSAPEPEPLTARELETLRLTAAGLANRDIAAVLRVTEGTVKTHLHHAYSKLGVRSRTAAVAASREQGLL